jgi:hypothetical protein
MARKQVEPKTKGNKQMTVLPNMDAVPTHAVDWDSIDWDQAHRAVKRLQARIAKATL